MINGVESRLSVLLGERKMKISKVANETGISRTTLTRLYYDQSRAVSFAVLGLLCNYLNCDIGDLLGAKSITQDTTERRC